MIWTHCANHEGNYMGPSTYGRFNLLRDARAYMNRYGIQGPKAVYAMDWENDKVVPQVHIRRH